MAEKENEKSEIGTKTAMWKLIVVVTAPILLLPIPLAFNGTVPKCAYVVILMTVYWMTECVPLAATALLPVALFPLMGVESAADTAANYFKDTNFLIFGSLLLAVAVEVTGLHHRIALRILLWFGARPQWLIFGFMNTAGFLSMWISNTATCAMMIPIVIVVLQETLGHRRRLQVPVGNKTSTAGHSDDQEKGEQGSQSKAASIFDDDMSREELGFCRAAVIGVSFASSVGGIGALTGATPNLILTGQLSQFYPEQNVITFANWFAFAMPMQILFLLFGWLWLLVLFMGWRSCLSCFAKKTQDDKSVSKLLRREYDKLGSIRFSEWIMAIVFTIVIILWVTREPGFVPGWGSWFKDGYVSDSTPVMLAACILFAFPSTMAPLLRCRRNTVGDSSCPDADCSSSNVPCGKLCCSLPSYRPIVSWTSIQDKFPWSVIILMGGGFALADGVKKSGLSAWLGCSLQSNLSSIRPGVIILIFLALMTAVSEFASNSATASIFVPILLTVAESMQINPLYFGMSAAIGASFGFMLPVATPPNMIVFERCKQLGILGPAEMIKSGLGLDVISITIAFISIHTFGNWVYNFNQYPSWAHHTANFTSCS